MELLVGAGVFVVVLSAVAIADRRRARTKASIAGAACSTDGACGCGPTSSKSAVFKTSPSADEPVACTADLKQTELIQAHIDEYRAAFASLIKTDHFAGGFRWRFRDVAGLDRSLRDLATREAQCCSFFTFEVTRGSGELIWEVRAPEHAASVLDEFARLPERLQAEQRRGPDVVSLKQHADAAGLPFTNGRPA